MRLRVPSGKMISDRPFDVSRLAQPTMPARSGLLRSTSRCPVRFKCGPSIGKAAERFLRDDAQLIRDRPEQAGDVVDALVIRDEHVGAARHEALEAGHRHLNARGRENQPRPRARAAVREVAAPIEEARGDRREAEHDRVDGDRRDQPEDCSEPVEGQDQAIRARGQRANRSSTDPWRRSVRRRDGLRGAG